MKKRRGYCLTRTPVCHRYFPLQAKMSQTAANEGKQSLETVPEQEPTTSPHSMRSDSAPVIFKDSFSPMGKDGQRTSIAVTNYSPDIRRPSEPPRRQSLIQFNTAPAEDTIRRESVAAGKIPSMDARKMSVGERRPLEGGQRRMSSPPPKRYAISFYPSEFSLSINLA